jgi:hypothetical protein
MLTDPQLALWVPPWMARGDMTLCISLYPEEASRNGFGKFSNCAVFTYLTTIIKSITVLEGEQLDFWKEAAECTFLEALYFHC